MDIEKAARITLARALERLPLMRRRKVRVLKAASRGTSYASFRCHTGRFHSGQSSSVRDAAAPTVAE
jgi:hypothetical protein